jgi:hypothetical protein
MNKLRSDSAFCQLTPEQVDVLEGWLFEERLGYPTVLEKLKAEFGLETSLTALRRFYKRLEMERSRASLMDAVEMGGLAVEALKSGTLKPGMLALANKCAVELMMQSPPPIREVTALLRAVTSAEAHAMKQTVFEREEQERQERERIRKARDGWRMTPADLEEEKEELRQERAAKRKAKQAAADRAAKESENAGVAEAKIERNLRGSSPSPQPKGFPSPPPVSCPERDVRFAQSGLQGEGEELAQRAVQGFNVGGSASGDPESKDEKGEDEVDCPATKDVGGVWQPSVLEEREYAEIYPAEEAENRVTPLNAA